MINICEMAGSDGAMTRRKYRSQAGIILDILEALEHKGPLNITKLMYYGNLPYDRLRETLSKLISQELITQCDESKYCLTPKGREALRKLREVRGLLESLGYKL